MIYIAREIDGSKGDYDCIRGVASFWVLDTGVRFGVFTGMCKSKALIPHE